MSKHFFLVALIFAIAAALPVAVSIAACLDH
jgi:hypothetical protein